MDITKLTAEQKNEIGKQATAELVKRYAKEKNILKWGKILFPKKFYRDFCSELHNYFIDIRNEKFTAIKAPRNHAKTIIKCFLIPIFQALNENEYKHYLNVQSTSSKGISVNLSIRNEIENNEILKKVYGNMQTDIKWTEKQFELKNGVVFTAIGTGESIRGISHNNIRPDYIIVDDLYDEEDINNPESIRKKNAWFWSTLFPARAQTKANCIHIQGTAINKEDILNLLEKVDGVISKSFKAIDFKNKTVLWPEFKSYEKWQEEIKIMPSVIFAREYQNEIYDDETAIIKESWLRYYDGMIPDEFQVVELRCGGDPSIGAKEISDYTGSAIIAKCINKIDGSTRYYIENVDQQHLSFEMRIQYFKNLHSRYGFTKCRIEGIAGFIDFASELRRQSDLNTEIITKVPDKKTNLERKSRWFENGKVFINTNINPVMKKVLVEQLITNEPNHDDIRDAVLLCIDDEGGKYFGKAVATQGF